ncbi:GMC family oxidoreductase [Akkermansiaceae bacterium]|nr:GMC family oxidoreductase [Akkermansiaceae bacterium]MDA7611663.1 GMC family oxidoreductase [bacterium]MDA7519080.1 GMC family oxidoreductase [Akkermansiaceae bacterium]MDA7675060.1 GMC family oxidoreductase [Akkermansiaceae bacterium]MDB4305364.1 GMC family oxidoreductase [Akkermansiaceae bacterium]
MSIEDAKEISKGTTLDCDVIIIGTGAAGTPCTCEFINSGKDVIVLESGGFEMDSATQALAEGDVSSPSQHGPLAQYRKRVFGGTTTVWGGRCSPFDEIDFEKRAGIESSGWPIDRSALVPFYEKAHDYLHLGGFNYESANSFADGDREIIPDLGKKSWSQNTLWRFSLPTDVGKENRQRLIDAPNVRVLLHANVTKLRTDATGAVMESVEVTSLEKNPFKVRARSVIVAAGGLESTRLLLASDDVHREGIGNENDLVGRYYCSHVSGDLGEVNFSPKARNVLWQYEQTSDGIYSKRQLRPKESVMKEEGLLNIRCITTHPPFADASHRSGVLSSAYLAKRFFKGQIPPEYSKELAAAGYHSLPQHIRNVILGTPSVIKFGTHWFFKRTIARRKYPSISIRSRANAYTIHFDAEQSPNRDSRISLGDRRDDLGQRLLTVDWKYRSADFESVMRWRDLLCEDLKSGGVGHFRQNREEAEDIVRSGFGVGSHHIGTTRMSESPRDGVVDSDCQIHGVEGLFIAAPSVFPTASFANPVLTTVALGLRIADHVLKR